MFSSLVTKSPVLSITLEDESIVLRPAADPSLPAPSEAVVRGTVLLTLSAPRAVQRIKVELEGACDVLGGSGFGYESTQTLYKDLEIDLKGEVLAKGAHALNFSFLVPSTTTTYQRSTYGRCRHWVRASAEFVGAFHSTVRSAPLAIWITATPFASDDSLLVQFPMSADSADLGPVSLFVSSAHLSVASLVNLKASFLAPPAHATIVSIQGVVEQTFTVHYNDPNIVARPPTERHVMAKVGSSAKPAPYAAGACAASSPLFNVASTSSASTSTASSALSSPALSVTSTRASSVSPARSRSPSQTRGKPEVVQTKGKGINGELVESDPKPLKRLEAGEEFEYSRLFRIHDDDYVRPSTLDGSDARIKVSHVLSVEIRYRLDGDSEDKMLKLSKPVTITSCCGLSASPYLPCYTRSAPKTIIKPVSQRCLCHLGLKDLLDRDGASLQRAGTIDVDPNAPALLIGADRENKSPAATEIDAWRAGVGSIAEN